MKRILVVAIFLVLASSYSGQERVSISRGFFTGREYLDMSDTEKRAYVTGAINGMLVSPFFGAPQDRVLWLKNCSAKLSDEQTAAILNKYINDEPGHMDESLNVVTFNAIKGACKAANIQ